MVLKFESQLTEGRFVSRYKRFFADIDLLDGQRITAHCANTGRMTGLLIPGAPVWVRKQPPGRQLKYAWELVKIDEEFACINTLRANHLIASHLDHKLFENFKYVCREPKVGTHRFDFKFFAIDQPVYVEVKSVTLCDGVQGKFPDAPSDRAVAHINLLTDLAAQHVKTMILFVAMHTGIDSVRPAKAIDPRFSKACLAAQASGVDIRAVGTEITPTGISITRELRVDLV